MCASDCGLAESIASDAEAFVKNFKFELYSLSVLYTDLNMFFNIFVLLNLSKLEMMLWSFFKFFSMLHLHLILDKKSKLVQ